MRIAVLADIHGNLRALEAVQRDLRQRAPDLVVNLGDHLSGPLEAARTADALMSTSYVHIRGNHDRQLLERPVERMGPSDLAAHSQMNARHREWLANLPATQRLEDSILLCHGSPADDLEYLLETVRADGVYLASKALVEERLRGVESKLVLCGHTHIPRVVSVSGGCQIVNPGSVGLQAYDGNSPCVHYMETGSPHARYALLDGDPAGWRITFLAIEYDWHGASEDARRANRPDWAQALATGYALRSA
jgi:putative phosphoesterase